MLGKALQADQQPAHGFFQEFVAGDAEAEDHAEHDGDRVADQHALHADADGDPVSCDRRIPHTAPAPTPHGVGKRYGGQILSSASKRPQAEQGGVENDEASGAFHGWAPGSMCGFTPIVVFSFEGAVDFVAQFVENFAGGAGDVGVFQMTRARQVDREFTLDAAGAEGQQNDAIAEANGFADVVGDENDGASGLAPDALQFVVQQVASLGVERGEGFVHQQNIGLGGKRAGDGHALPHAAGELVSVAVLEFAEMHQAQVVVGLFLALGLGNALHLHAEFDVLSDREPREQAVLLEDENAIGAGPCDRFAVDQDLAGGLGDAGPRSDEAAWTCRSRKGRRCRGTLRAAPEG